MTGQESILGSHNERVRTDVRLPPDLAKQVGIVCRALGIPRNAFYTIAACEQMVKLSPLIKGKKRGVLVKELDKIVQKIQKNIQNLS